MSEQSPTEIRGGADSIGGITLVKTHGKDFSQTEALGFEREVLRRYVSSSPLDGWSHELAAERFGSLDDILEADSRSLPDGTQVQVTGHFYNLYRRVGKGKSWAGGEFQDEGRSIEVVFWSQEYAANRKLLQVNRPMVMQATAKRSSDRPTQLVGQSVKLLERHPPGCECIPPDTVPTHDIEVTEQWLSVLRELKTAQEFGAI